MTDRIEPNNDLVQDLGEGEPTADIGMKSITNGVRSLMLAIRKKVHHQKKRPSTPHSNNN